MYEQVYNFSAKPFTSTPYVKHYFANEAIHKALGQARISIDRALGPVVVTGGTGTGKSLMMAMLEEQYRAQFTVVNLACARLDSRTSLLQAILFELDQPISGLSENELRFSLIEFLKPNKKCPNGVLLLIDDAHSLDVDLLDEVRLITNFVRDGQPRIRLIMAGNQKLEHRLTDPKLESFNQRVSSRCYLQNMSRQDTANYVIEHINRVGGNGEMLFDQASLKAIHGFTDGCPRLVNQICDHALIIIATRGQTQVTEDCVNEAWSVVQSIPGLYQPSEKGADSVAAPTTTVENTEWTVLEFGELDDSPESNSEGTTYELLHAQTDQESNPKQHVDQETAIEDQEEVYEKTSQQTNSVTVEVVASDAEALAEAEEPTPELSTDDQDSESETSNEQKEHELNLLSQQLQQYIDANPEEINWEAQEGQSETSQLDESLDQTEDADAAVVKEIIEDSGDQPLDEFATDKMSSEIVEDHELVIEAELSDDVDSQEELPEDVQSRLRPVHETVNPFDESFEEEEHLIDRYGPYVAYQNQSSLNITSEELQSINVDEEVENDLEAVSASSVSESMEENLDEVHETMDAAAEEVQYSDPEETSTSFHEHITEAASEDIENEAQAILSRLAAPLDVSCETDVVEEPEVSEEKDVLAETQEILNDILEEKRKIANQQESAALEETDQPSAVEYSLADQNPDSHSQDDREMIIVNRMESQSESTEEQDVVPFPSTPISTGRAERMDYQKLFDQLREASDIQRDT